MTLHANIARIAVLAALGSPCLATGGSGIWTDAAGDARTQRTDAGNNAALPPGFVPIDLLGVSVRGWIPNSVADPYSGSFVGPEARADVFRIDVTIDGLVAPPGPGGFNGFGYDPYRFGDRPLFGFIELDIDDQKNSGGELTPLAFNRYLANVGRFGLSPYGSISDRMIRSQADADQNFFTGPQFERTGGEFALALCGCWPPTIVSQSGNQDGRFDAGETWIVRGRFFERFQAVRPASALFGGSQPGLFDPMVNLRFHHDTASDTTTVTLVYALTNAGAATLAGVAQQGMDYNISNQTSLEEALADLIESYPFATGPVLELLDPWEGRDYDDYRKPNEWGVNALIGTMPLVEEPTGLFVWTDTGFGEVFGDLDNDDAVGPSDRAVITGAVATLDGTASDADGIVDGRVTIPDFGRRFDLRDLNGDGVIDQNDADLIGCRADLAEPFGVINFFDLAAFVSLFQQQDPAADTNGDGLFNFFDFPIYLGWFNEPCVY